MADIERPRHLGGGGASADVCFDVADVAEFSSPHHRNRVRWLATRFGLSFDRARLVALLAFGEVRL
jgi:hypothetical protein